MRETGNGSDDIGALVRDDGGTYSETGLGIFQ